MSRSIVTIQLGNYANFVGSHYWNLHEYEFQNTGDCSIDPDVHYSEGLTSNNITTYTPRLISMDWKENLGAKVIDDVYEEIENEGKRNPENRRDIGSLKVRSYSGKVDFHTGLTEKEQQINKQGLFIPQNNYSYWNEYLYSRYHPRSLVALPKLYRGLNKDNFKNFSQGTELFNFHEFRDNIEEQTRYFVEKCDSLQGFQMLCDTNSGFGGVAAAWLEHINDEYRQPVVSIPVRDENESTTDSLFNTVSLMTSLNSSSVITAPMSLSQSLNIARDICNIKYNRYSKYQTSAIIALAIKSLTLPCVLSDRLYSLFDFNSLVCDRSNNFASMALSLLPLQENRSYCDTLLDISPDNLFTVLNPFSDTISKVNSAVGNVHGVPESRLLSVDQQRKRDSVFKNCSSVSDTMETYINDHFKLQQSRFFSLPKAFRLNEPFPKIFTSNVNQLNGEILRQSSLLNQLICPNEISLSTMIYTDDSSENLIPIYTSAKEALRRNNMCDLLSLSERDSLVDVLENFRNII